MRTNTKVKLIQLKFRKFMPVVFFLYRSPILKKGNKDTQNLNISRNKRNVI